MGERLAARVRHVLRRRVDVVEEQMLEGLAFRVDGPVAVCVTHDGDLLVRTTSVAMHLRHDRDGAVSAFRDEGPGSSSWLRVDGDAVGDEVSLRGWVAIGVAVVGSMPPGAA